MRIPSGQVLTRMKERKRNMKKNRIITALMAAVMVTAFSSCESGDISSALQGPTTQAPVTEAKVTYNKLAELDGKFLGLQPGTNFDQLILERLPNAMFKNYDSFPELLDALKQGKIDGFPSDEPVVLAAMATDDSIKMLDEYIEAADFAYAFPKTEEGTALCEEFSAYIDELKSSGKLEEYKMKWMGADESAKTVLDISMLPATKGTLNMVTEGDYEPFNYFKEGKVVGLDIDIAADFCKAKGYALNVEVTEFSKIIPAIQESKYDFAGAGITVTDERKEVVNFSSPNYSGGVVMVVRK